MKKAITKISFMAFFIIVTILIILGLKKYGMISNMNMFLKPETASGTAQKSYFQTYMEDNTKIQVNDVIPYASSDNDTDTVWQPITSCGYRAYCVEPGNSLITKKDGVEYPTYETMCSVLRM